MSTPALDLELETGASKRRKTSPTVSKTRGRRKGRSIPCDPCREKHLKCQDPASVCSRCERTGITCVRSSNKTGVKFRPGSRQKYDTEGFSEHQTWLASGRAAALKYVDETALLAARYPQRDDSHSSDSALDADPAPTLRPGLGPNAVEAGRTTSSPARTTGHNRYNSTSEFDLISPTIPGDAVNAWPASVHGRASWGASSSMKFPSPVFVQGHGIQLDQSPYKSGLPSSSSARSIVDGLIKTPSFSSSVQIGYTALEVVLLRYFISTLAHWFDLCDDKKHFELIVPNRSRWCAPLRNALLATSARHLTRVQSSQHTVSGAYYFESRAIPDLTAETALHYHNESITDLLTRSMDPEESRNEDLLAAAIILRYYEEIDQPLRDENQDSELFLRVMSVFIDAQIVNAPLFPHVTANGNTDLLATTSKDHFSGHAILPSPENMQSPVASTGTPRSQAVTIPEDSSWQWRAEGLCQACFWVAFRQEIHSAFLKQRSFNLIISRSDNFGSFSTADDTVWADRLINFCAEALEFCYGSSKTAPVSSGLPAKERWLSLKQYEKTLSEVLPASFEPLYWREPDVTKGEVFPEISYLSDCHVAGVQHCELAKILLAVYDPTRPKLGPGHVASRRALNQELKKSVLRLCGIAMSNRKTPPGLVTASLGIAMCGDYFEHRQEQEALMSILNLLEGEHAWPVGDVREALRAAWGWNLDGDPEGISHATGFA